jgi:hypothetical protein
VFANGTSVQSGCVSGRFLVANLVDWVAKDARVEFERHQVVAWAARVHADGCVSLVLPGKGAALGRLVWGVPLPVGLGVVFTCCQLVGAGH